MIQSVEGFPALNNASLKPQYTPQPAIVYRGNPRKFGRARKWFLRFGIATVAILLVAICFLWAYWPFRPKAVIEVLEEASQTQVKSSVFTVPIFRALVVFSITWFFSTIWPRGILP